MRIYFLIVFFLLLVFKSEGCNCVAFPPLTKALFESGNKKLIVFKGRVLSVGACKELGSVVFQVEELYSGKSTKQLNAVYDCSGSTGEGCMMTFNAGEEWIIYGEYLQLEKIKVEFCSRSRKILAADYADVDQIAYGIGAKDEIDWLRTNIGIKELTPDDPARALAHKNEKPDPMQKIWLLIVSIVALVIFMLLIKRFLK
jgi:hypothetical protein